MVVEDTTVVMTVEAMEVITTTDNITETGIAMCEVQAIIATITITTIVADIITETDITTVLIMAAIVLMTVVMMTMMTAMLGNNETATNKVAVTRKGNRRHPPP